jgi:superoxide reductase
MSVKRNQIYKCAHSGLTMEVLTDGDSCVKLECCGDEMVCLQEKTADAGKEKHVPVVTGDDKGIKVTVGTISHPMEESHYIVWIEVVNGQYVNRKYLKPGEAPVAEFYVPMQRKLEIRSYCNLHGLWKGGI